MTDALMPLFVDPREFHVLNNQSYAFSPNGQVNSSFGSSASYDECYTPPRRGSSSVGDMDLLSSSSASLGSNGPSSPVDDAMFYSLMCLNNMAKGKTDDNAHLYVTPCHKSIPDHTLMNYNHSHVDSGCGPLDLDGSFDRLPGATFDGIPGLLFHDSSSPLPLRFPPDNFVVPSQTFISEPYRPITPMNSSRAVLGSPLEYSQSEEPIKYFMSPREPSSQTPCSGSSSASHLALQRTPPMQTLESSIALHCIQSIGSSRVSKQSKRSLQVALTSVPSGFWKCDYPGCKSEHGFKRHEHLKRHQRTHGAQKPLQCQFCAKKFQQDRQDNYKAHVILHANNKKGSRTQYFPEAQSVVDSFERKRPAGKELHVPGGMHRMYTRRTRAKA